MASPISSVIALLKEFHSDLARKYKTHATKLEQIWRSFDSNQRETFLRDRIVDGIVFRNKADTKRGSSTVHKLIVPEMNVEDIARSGPNFLLELLKFRTTTSLLDQFKSGMRGGQGDSAIIQETIDTILASGIIVDPLKDQDCYFFFLYEEDYGMMVMNPTAEDLQFISLTIKQGSCLPSAIATVVLERQVILMQTLDFLIDDILSNGSKTRDSKEPEKPAKPTTLSTIAQISSKKPTLHGLLATANDQREACEEYLALLTAEPSLLSHTVKIRFFTRPELVRDDCGRVLPVQTDKYISPVFFEAIVAVIQGAATWNYIGRLLGLLDDPAVDKDTAARTTLLQELSNVCHAEYIRMQNLLKRNIQIGSGSEWFKRIAGAVDKEGNARVTMKGDPARLTRSDPQLHYILRLCQPGISASQALEWANKLGGLHRNHPEVRENLAEREAEALCDLVNVIDFIYNVSQVVRPPPPSGKRGRVFASGYQSLNVELDKLKDEIDLRDFAVPIDNLREPGMADAALKTMDKFVRERAGTGLGFLYQDLVDDSVSNLRDQCLQVASKAKAREMAGSTAAPVFVDTTTTPQTAERVEQRRAKPKTRPATNSTYELFAPSSKDASAAVTDRLASCAVAGPAATPTFKVSSTTASVFSTLFTKSESRGSIHWTAFESAMADLGFSVLPKFGSVYTFFPPDSMGVDKSFTTHRPHQSEIEGVSVPILARRLRRVYGWDEKSFELA